MTKKIITAVITLVSKNTEHYFNHSNEIINLLEKYKIKIFKTNKLSDLVKDFFINIKYDQLEKIKLDFKSNLFGGSDLCIQENFSRKKKIIACDMDKTVITIETIDLIAKRILKNSNISKLTEKAMRGNLNFKKSIEERTKILKGISVDEIINIISSIKITNNAEKVIKTLNKNGCHTLLISGGYNLVADIIGKKIGFKEIISNKPVLNNGRLTGELKGTLIDGKGKLNFLKKIMKINNANKYETLAIGDGYNDIEMIKFSGLGISWKGFPKVNIAADAIANNNFKSMLYFQGYMESEIIT